jgi:hypothetical protein
MVKFYGPIQLCVASLAKNFKYKFSEKIKQKVEKVLLFELMFKVY